MADEDSVTEQGCNWLQEWISRSAHARSAHGQTCSVSGTHTINMIRSELLDDAWVTVHSPPETWSMTLCLPLLTACFVPVQSGWLIPWLANKLDTSEGRWRGTWPPSSTTQSLQPLGRSRSPPCRPPPLATWWPTSMSPCGPFLAQPSQQQWQPLWSPLFRGPQTGVYGLAGPCTVLSWSLIP